MAAPRHPLLAEYLRIFKDTMDHDSKAYETSNYVVEFGGAGMWMYAIYSICNLNPNGQ